jgi:hypothetical protein
LKSGYHLRYVTTIQEETDPMSRADNVQFNVRSAFVRARAQELARLTGMTATQIVEDALRAYVPPASTPKVGRLVRRGALLVHAAGGGSISLDAANEALEESRGRDLGR